MKLYKHALKNHIFHMIKPTKLVIGLLHNFILGNNHPLKNEK